MKKIRPIRKSGNSYFIKLCPADLKDFEIEVGDFVDIMEIQKVEVKDGNKRSSKKNK